MVKIFYFIQLRLEEELIRYKYGKLGLFFGNSVFRKWKFKYVFFNKYLYVKQELGFKYDRGGRKK